MQRRPTVGQVQGDAPAARLDVDRVAVGTKAATSAMAYQTVHPRVAPLDGEGLVEVAAAGRVEGDQGEVAPVVALVRLERRIGAGRRRLSGRRRDRVREGGGNLVLGADGRQAGGHGVAG